MKLLNLLATAFTAGALALGAAPSHAADSETVSIKVSMAGLDLNSEAGAKVLLHRIKNAARSICGPQPDIGFFAARGDWDKCVAGITDHTLASLNNRLVTAAADKPAARPLLLSAADR